MERPAHSADCASAPERRKCTACMREVNAARKRAQYERDRAEYGRANPHTVVAQRRERAASALDLLTFDGRWIGRIGGHVYGALTRPNGETLWARVPRSETWRTRAVPRDMRMNTRQPARPVTACEHGDGAHVWRKHHVAAPLDWRVRRMLDMAGALTPGNGGCVREGMPFAVRDDARERGAAWARERELHVQGGWRVVGEGERERVKGCTDCQRGYALTSYGASVRKPDASDVFHSVRAVESMRRAARIAARVNTWSRPQNPNPWKRGAAARTAGAARTVVAPAWWADADGRVWARANGRARIIGDDGMTTGALAARLHALALRSA